MTVKDKLVLNPSAIATDRPEKPRLLFFAGCNLPKTIRSHDDLPLFIRSHLQQHIKCLSTFFDVRVVREDGDYKEICEQYEPDLTLVESGVYGGPPNVKNVSAYPEIPKLGLLNADAYCLTRSVFLSDMERWGIETYFTISVSMPEYMPAVADRLFIWPNFIDPDVYYDYGQPKMIPVLITGSQAMHYPWRNRINREIAQHFPSLTCPHFGWFDSKMTSGMVYGEEYAKLINASWFVPTCGTITKEVVRKHFEIPGCKSCLVTERTPALEAAGFVDMQNCVFATDADVLDKLEHLFKNRDVLDSISSEGYRLVQTHHTLRQRNQMLQWLMLHKCLQPHQKIIQNQPFGPLTIIDSNSRRTNFCGSNGLDRELLRKGDTQLRFGNYEEAERYYLSCLNYHAMPEPMLGLTLCSLYKGDSRKALEWISWPITQEIERHKAMDPDPVEWAYFIISLLCRGDVKEATRRAHQFPFLHHQELDRCRWLIDTLNHSAYESSEPGQEHGSATLRPSIHSLPQRDMVSWVKELCRMLAACKQAGLAEHFDKMVCPQTTQTPLPSYRQEESRMRESGLLWWYRKRPHFPIWQELKVRYQLANIRVPLTKEPFLTKIFRFALSSGRTLSTSVRSLVRREDEFASAIQAFAAYEDRPNSALILGACDRSAYTHAFLDGIKKNPSMPIALCVGSSRSHLQKLSSRLGGRPRIQFSSSPLVTANNESKLEYFDIVLIDRYAAGDEEALPALTGAKTIIISNINTHPGYKMASKLLSDGEYRVVYEKAFNDARSVILTKTHRGDTASRRTGDDSAVQCS